MRLFKRRPDLSVVIAIYNMAREAPRTLHSLSAAYQRDIDARDYEVIVIDNGSDPPFKREVVAKLEGNFRLIRLDQASPSPAAAVNYGIAQARGEVIGLMIDGARLTSPGLLHFALRAARLYRRAVVASLGWYLGFDFQRLAMRAGYDQAREDALLASIGWPADGYRLFDVATFDESSIEGWFDPISESNALFLSRETWNLLGGVDERFSSPGGGLVNLDTFRRAVGLPESELVILLGEGTFHQLHGGVATNADPKTFARSYEQWTAEYQRIRGRSYELPHPRRRPTYLGVLPRPALARFTHAAVSGCHPWLPEPPLGRAFDRMLWSPEPPVRPVDPALAAAIAIAHGELRAGRYDSACAVARLVRSRAPDEAEPQRLLSLVARRLPEADHAEVNAPYHFALAEAHRLLGGTERAKWHYHTALKFDGSLAPQVSARLATAPAAGGSNSAP
jgi:hypothetical protein